MSDNGASVVTLEGEPQLGRALAVDDDICSSITSHCTYNNTDDCEVTFEDAARCMDSVKIPQEFRDRVVESLERQVGAFYVYHDIIANSTNRDSIPPAPCGLATHDIEVCLVLFEQMSGQGKRND